MSEVTGRLEDWHRGINTGKEFILWGRCYDDVEGRFPDGIGIHTSGIKNRSVREGDIVETRNSTYKLGKELINI